MSAGTLLVIAKAPVPGRVKTRLCPPLEPADAAAVAEAALRDTLGAVLATPADRRVLVLDGSPGDWLPDGIEVVPQAGGGLDERLGAAFAGAAGPTLLVGMDTPQVTPCLLGEALGHLLGGADAVLGAAVDGGFWAVGLREADPSPFPGVPMSTPSTGAEQRRRLEALGHRVVELPVLLDVDHVDDLAAVAALAPRGDFARVVGRLDVLAAPAAERADPGATR